MKFAIPLADGKLTAHFGHCREFAIIETEGIEGKQYKGRNKEGEIVNFIYNFSAKGYTNDTIR